MDLRVLDKARHDPWPYWHKALPPQIEHRMRPRDVYLFDQNGYDMCEAEQIYAILNGYVPQQHRERWTYKIEWMRDVENSVGGAHLNHADLYMRRGFCDEAYEQLLKLGDKWPVFHKLANMKPKWGIDISVDYADSDGNTFELLHYEWDDFNLPVVLEKKTEIEQLIQGVNWDQRAKEMLERKDEWYPLDFFAQSDWKAEFWGLSCEKFKEVVW